MAESAVALERIAAAAGYKVGFPKAQWCCGLIAANAGDFKAGATTCATSCRAPFGTPRA